MTGSPGSIYARQRRQSAPAGYVVVSWFIAAAGLVACLLLGPELSGLAGSLMIFCSALTMAGGWSLHDRSAVLFGGAQIWFVCGLAAAIVWMPYPVQAMVVMSAAGAVYVGVAGLWARQIWKQATAFRPWECQSCGYILIGLSGERCPECGEKFDPEKVAAAVPPHMLGMTPGR